MDGDTWFAVCVAGGSGARQYINVRTGTASNAPPSGCFADGRRRRSAAASGPWAVPFTSPPPELPSELRHTHGCGYGGPGRAARTSFPSSAASRTWLHPAVEVFGSEAGAGVVFTAPHGINLERDGKPEHLPEDFTSYLARAWAAHTKGVSLSWGLAALAHCCDFETPLPGGARDPNYLLESEAPGNEWVRALRELPRTRGLHVDVHGKADREGEGACDVGTGALRAAVGDEAADAVAAVMAEALAEVLSPLGYTVDRKPRLQGRWRSVPRLTLTQSSSRLCYVPVQLELGYALRRALGRDPGLCRRTADAFLACAPACVAVASPQRLQPGQASAVAER